MKYAGYDVTILTGRAKEPSYLFIDNDTVEIRSGSHLWGKGSTEVEEILKTGMGQEFQILTIGEAGERMVNFACISHDFGRQAGRTGIGTVLGSNHIKAIAVHGTKNIPVFDPKGLLKKGKQTYAACREKPGFTGWAPEGTAGITNWCNDVGALPARNFATSHCDYADQINGKAILDELKITDKACFSYPSPAASTGWPKPERTTNMWKARNTKPWPWWAATASCPTSMPWPMSTGCATNWGWIPIMPPGAGMKTASPPKTPWKNSTWPPNDLHHPQPV